MNSDSLNKDFAIDGKLQILPGKGDLPVMKISTDKASALISLYAAQVLSFRPAGAREDLLFVSDAAYYQDGKAIKGGIPLCWPWFGNHPVDPTYPAHGFVRTQMWRILETELMSGGDIRIVLGGPDPDTTQSLWPHDAALTLEVLIGDSLSLALVTRNRGDVAFTLTQALHTYFRIGDIDRVKVLGLEETDYLDKPDAFKQKQQQGPVTIAGEVDRIYLDVKPELIIEDEQLQRRIHIKSVGNNTAVVWNPWQAIAANMGDLLDDDYRRFLCVETSNAASDVVRVEPGGEYRLEAVFSVA